MVAPHPAIHPCVHGCRAPPYSHPWGWRRVWWPWRSHHHSASMELRAHANRGLCLQMESGLARRSTRRHLLCSPPLLHLSAPPLPCSIRQRAWIRGGGAAAGERGIRHPLSPLRRRRRPRGRWCQRARGGPRGTTTISRWTSRITATASSRWTSLLTQNLYLAPSTQQAEQAGFTREEITRRASQFSLKINKRQSS
jgi:hypothetical protein